MLADRESVINMRESELRIASELQLREERADRNAIIEEINFLWSDGHKLAEEGRIDEALDIANSIYASQEDLFGINHEETIRTISWAAELYEVKDDYLSAVKCRQMSLQASERLLGSDHWKTIDCKWALVTIQKVHELSSVDRRRLQLVTRDEHAILNLYQAGNHESVIKLAMRPIATYKELLGEFHPQYANSLLFLANCHVLLGDYSQAEILFQQVLKIYRESLGENHPQYASSLNALANLHLRQGDNSRAKPLFEQTLNIRKQVLGEKHPEFAASLYGLANVYVRQGEFKQAEALLQESLVIRKQLLGKNDSGYADSLHSLAVLYSKQGKYSQAEPLLLQTLEITKQALGEKNPVYSDNLKALANLYKELGDFAQAEPLLQQALDITKQVQGENHPEYATCLNDLAGLHLRQGRYTQAERCFLHAMEITKQALGEKNPEYAATLNNLAYLYEFQGDYVRAEPLLRQTLEILKEALGEKHPHYAASLQNLSQLYELQGDYSRAEPLLKQALEINKQALGGKHPEYAEILRSLGGLYLKHENYALAEPLLKQALEINKESLGELHPRYAHSLHDLAVLYLKQEDNAKAEWLLRLAVEINAKALGEDHPEYAVCLNSLAEFYQEQDDYDLAEPLLHQAREITKQTLGEKHSNYAAILNNLAYLYFDQRDYEQSEPIAVEGLHIQRKILEMSSSIQSERQQLQMLTRDRQALDLYLSIQVLIGSHSESSYREMLAWKGMVLSRQRKQRAASSQPELALPFAQLQGIAGQLASLTLSTTMSGQMDAREKRIAQLSEEKEMLERELSEKSREFRAAMESPTLEELQANLPSDTTLVDFLEYWRAGVGKQPRERRLLAFVVNRRKVVGPIDLTSSDELQEQIDLWRQSLGKSPESVAAGQWLREKLWDSIAGHLQDAKVVLVSPDGALGKLPLVALPGKKPGTYLLEEELLIATVPVPQMIPEMLAKLKEEIPSPALCVIGGVDYDGQGETAPSDSQVPHPMPPISWAVNRSGIRAAARMWNEQARFSGLTHTLDEALAIEKRFKHRFVAGTVVQLTNAAATEAAFRSAASKSTYLHLATHGYFAPASFRSVLAPKTGENQVISLLRRESEFDVPGFHPGLLSGIALAGANRQPEPERDDGILTAEEVATLNLSATDLVVLSACETGLGQAAGGEGLLGLQRAFQVSGARTVVASLWNVGDEPTRLLMEEFYKRLWDQDKPTSKLAALREAQLWMLRDSQSQAIRGGKSRGLTSLDEQPAEQDNRLPPFYWAAFVLSGDWR